MKTKNQTEIIFETYEITKVHFGRRQTETTFDAPPENENQDDLLLIENSGGLKARLKEMLREFWKRNRRLR
ncbi:MAG: hypothetical protein ACR2HG_10515 [Pyrinomonadaceae bacterium]